jgi:multidrug resistance efflux pump
MTSTRLLAGSVALALTAACAAKPAPDTDVVAVALATAGAPQALAAYAGPGTVEAVHTYRIGFEIPGRIARITADVGDRVYAGETLATLDASSYADEYAAANAQAAAASAQAQRALDGSRPQEIEQAQAQLERAQGAADLASANARRAQMLFAGGAISAQERDAAVQAQRDADGTLDAARAQFSLAKQGARTEDRTAAVASAAAARAQAALAANTLAKTAIVAPADAYVQSRSIEAGSNAEPGAVAFVLTDASTPHVYANVPERIAQQLHAGDGATVVDGGQRLPASIVRIEPAADPVTRTRQVRLAVHGLASQPGGVVRVELGRTAHVAGASVPLAAVMTSANGTSVDTYDPATGTIAVQRVRLLASQEDRALVSGIAPGTRIVIAGQYEAHAGDKVRIVAKDGAQ